jgi:hypothetical protein
VTADKVLGAVRYLGADGRGEAEDGAARSSA